MRYIITNYSKAYYNMALEQMLMEDKRFNEEYLFFYIHTPSIIVGKNQNTFAEINPAFVKEHNITVARRISGGGAVYHDEGNLNFSFVCKRNAQQGIDFARFTKPVINALKTLGVNADLSERNDILIEGRKFSGNAEYLNKEKILHHGTLMIDVNIENLVNALHVNPLKLQSKAIQSVRSRVANLNDFLPEPMTSLQFRDFLVKSLQEELSLKPLYLDENTKKIIQEKVQTTFSTYEYNFSRSPKASFEKKKKFPFGLVEAYVDIQKGKIKNIHFFGDFFFKRNISELEELLTDTPFTETDVRKKLETVPVDEYIHNIHPEELTNLLFE